MHPPIIFLHNIKAIQFEILLFCNQELTSLMQCQWVDLKDALLLAAYVLSESFDVVIFIKANCTKLRF